MQPITVRCIHVKADRIAFEVELSDARYRYSSPGLARYVCDRFPELPRHACVNSAGSTFAAVMNSTSCAHLLEHVAISILVRNSKDENALFVGTTEWLDEASGLARIELSFRDDLESLRAFNEAVKFLNDAVLTCIS